MSKPAKFQKKPVVIEAMQYTGDNADLVHEFMEPTPLHVGGANDLGLTLVIPTLEGDHVASPGDWIIKGVAGEFYPCKPDIFEQTYDPASEKAP